MPAGYTEWEGETPLEAAARLGPVGGSLKPGRYPAARWTVCPPMSPCRRAW